MDRIYFKVNGEKYSVGSEVDSDTSVLFYVRNTLNLRGTKYMCREGGCGACIVAVTAPTSLGGKRTFSINSCLVSITSCQDWDITTPEGLGGRRRGFHPIQRTLAEHNGTQCGYCSPGWTMSMYSILEASNYNLTQYEIENSFGSNICRCTGYRPILEAFKTFANDAPKPLKIPDIEDLQICKKGGNCSKKDICKVDYCRNKSMNNSDSDSLESSKTNEDFNNQNELKTDKNKSIMFIEKDDNQEPIKAMKNNDFRQEFMKDHNNCNHQSIKVTKTNVNVSYELTKDNKSNDTCDHKFIIDNNENDDGRHESLEFKLNNQKDGSNSGISEEICHEEANNEFGWCFISKSDTEPKDVKRILLKDKRVWYRVNEIVDIFNIFAKEGTTDYMLVNGNTARGAYHIFAFPQLLIDISPVSELKQHYLDQNLVVGCGVTLTDLMMIFKQVSQVMEEFSYLIRLYEHLDLVAHKPVRNIGTIGGNLMLKHRVRDFASDVFLLFESIGAMLTIVSVDSTIEVTPAQFLQLDMTWKVLTNVQIPPLSKNYHFTSLKIMPRYQNAHAQVNGAFLYQFDIDKETLKSARIVFGGISSTFVHATHTEHYVVGKKIFHDEVLQEALKVLHEELHPEEIRGDDSPEFRKKLALDVFYKGLLQVIPENRLSPRYRSGRRDIHRTRPLSRSSQVYDTNPIIWPITEPMPKVEALVQCAGEAPYVNDEPTQASEVHCAFVTSDICTGEIEHIDPTPALNLQGVITFLTVKDIPGQNSFLSQKVPSHFIPEEIFADKFVKYYDQAIGMIVAETEDIANRAALLVHIKYKNEKKPILYINQAKEEDPSRVTLFLIIPARNRGADVQRVIKDTHDIYWQYHFPMETLQSVTRPNENGMDVFASTQWLDSTQLAVADSLAIPQNRVNLSVPRIGGSYGLKISRANHVTAACALATNLLGRPARFVLSIQGSLRIIGKRLPVTNDFEVGVNNEGEIQFLEYHFYEDNGYIFTDQVIVPAISAIKNCYDNQRWQYKLFNVVTDTPSNTWARAPGSLEAIIMTEQIMEQISVELDRDPLDVRRRNLNPEYPEVTEIIQKLVQDSEYEKRKEDVEKYNKVNRWKKRGLGVALMSWPVLLISDYSVLLSVFHGDGTVVIKHGGVEMGQGVNTKVIQTVAYTLNIPMDKIIIRNNDVNSNPNNLTTGGSRTSEAVCFGAIKCCQLLLDRLSVIRDTLTDPTWELLILAAFTAGINLQTSYHVNSNDQTIYRIAGAAVSEVELDILTGEHEILRVDIIEDVGTSANPEIDIGQIEGAFIMGVGYWTSEKLIYDNKTGELLTDRTWNYYVPMAKDIPIDFRVQLRRNSYNPVSTLGAKAVGEPAINLSISVAFALRRALMSSREESGLPRNKWFNVEGPFSIESNVLKAETKLEEFRYTDKKEN